MSINPRDSQFRIDAELPRHTRTPYKISIGIGLSLLVLSGALFWKLQPVIPLFYTLPQANQQLASKYWIFLFPVMSIATTLTNFALIKKNADLEPLLISIISWVTATWQIILVMVFIRIILITW